jgi:hypothetical protein
MKTMKNLFLLILTISIFSCSDDDAPPCVTQTWYADADGDSLGDPNVLVEQCEQPEGFVGNSNDSDDSDPLNLDPIIGGTFENLHAPQAGGQGQPASGEFVKFNFSTGEITESETEWDIAFRATTIIINGGTGTGLTDAPERNGNGGAYIHDEIFENISDVNVNDFAKDDNDELAIPKSAFDPSIGWYTYNSTTHIISPTINKNLIIKTHDGKYAKVKIINYYKDLQDTDYTQSGYYTFDYVYQPNEGLETF